MGPCVTTMAHDGGTKAQTRDGAGTSDEQGALPVLLQQLDLFGKRELLEPQADGALALQNFAHPISHFSSPPVGTSPRPRYSFYIAGAAFERRTPAQPSVAASRRGTGTPACAGHAMACLWNFYILGPRNAETLLSMK